MRKSLEEQQEEQELQSNEQWAQELNDAETSAQMDAAFEDHLQQQIDEQLESERQYVDLINQHYGNVKVPDDLFAEFGASPSSEEQLFHQILSDERDANSKIQYK